MLTTEQLSDDRNAYSTTRWAFVVVIRFAMIMCAAAFIAFIVLRVLGIDTEGLFSGTATMLGIVTGLATTAKALQGFETGKERKTEPDKEEEQAIR